MWAAADGVPIDADALEAQVDDAVRSVVRRQVDAGISVVNDGPDDKVICLGVIEPQPNYIEHPEVVAQRIERWATVVDPERLMAGVDCGFSVHVGMRGIDPDVALAKLASLAQGSEIASKRMFA